MKKSPKDTKEVKFMECDTCRAKTGMPTLCWGCLHNRSVIDSILQERLLAQREIVQKAIDYFSVMYVKGYNGDSIELRKVIMFLRDIIQ